jgi:hypothetical protein
LTSELDMPHCQSICHHNHHLESTDQNNHKYKQKNHLTYINLA